MAFRYRCFVEAQKAVSRWRLAPPWPAAWDSLWRAFAPRFSTWRLGANHCGRRRLGRGGWKVDVQCPEPSLEVVWGMGLHDNHTAQVGFLKRGSFAAQQGMWRFSLTSHARWPGNLVPAKKTKSPLLPPRLKLKSQAAALLAAASSAAAPAEFLHDHPILTCVLEVRMSKGHWKVSLQRVSVKLSMFSSLLMSFAWPVGSGRQSSRLWPCRKGPVAGSRLIETRATHRLCDVWSSWLCMDHCSAHGAPKAHECSSSVKPIRI